MKSIVLIGAGSVQFMQGLVADMIQSGRPWEVRLCDINPEALETAERICRMMIETVPNEVTVKADTDRRKLLPGADAVVTTIAVGGRKAHELDVRIPRNYGIYAPVGDTALPSGISRALRHIPVMCDIARDVADLCPQAIFVNYSNPMSTICRGVRQETGVPIIGLCHGTFHTQRYLAKYAGVPAESTKSVAVGVNHLTWFLELTAAGRDLMPVLAAKRRQMKDNIRFDEKMDPALLHSTPEGIENHSNPLSWQLFDLFGAFPAVFDIHVMEFFPTMCREGGYYGATPGNTFWKREEHGIKRHQALYQSLYEQAHGLRPFDTSWTQRKLAGEQEQLVDILCSIWDDKPIVINANLPNEGQVSNLPLDAILECPCLVNNQGIRPLNVGAIDSNIAAVLQRVVDTHQATVEAALSGDLKLLTQALLLDGAVTTPNQALALATELVEAQQEHLPRFAR